MTAIKSQHSRVFEQSIAARRQVLLESLAFGHETNTYWRIVGQLDGLNEALKISEEADFNISGDEPDAGA